MPVVAGDVGILGGVFYRVRRPAALSKVIWALPLPDESSLDGNAGVPEIFAWPHVHPVWC